MKIQRIDVEKGILPPVGLSLRSQLTFSTETASGECGTCDLHFKKKACGQPAPALRSALSPQGILLLLISLPAPHSQSLQALLNLHKLLCYMDATFWSSWEQGVALTWRNKAHLWLLTQARKDSASQGMVRSWPSLPSSLILPYSAALQLVVVF